jgi:signal transduction histidine kinase
MKYQWIIPLIAGLANLTLAVIVLSRGRRPLHTAFALLTATLILWNTDIFGLYFFDDSRVALAWARVFRVGPILMPTAVISVCYLFAGRTDRWRKLGVWSSVALAIVLLALNAFDLLVAHVQRLEWGYYPVGTAFYNLLSLNLLLAMAYSTAMLLWEIRQGDSPRKRLQARLWLLGAGVALPLGCTNLLPAYGIPIYPLGNIGNAAWAAIVAYAIVRHRLMDIDLVVTKGMAYAAVSFVLIVPVFTVTLWLQRRSFGQVHADFSAFLLLAFITIGVLFPRLRLRAESSIQRSLFRQKHEYRAALSAFTRSIVRILDREKLVRELIGTLCDALALERIGIALYEPMKNAFTVTHEMGESVAPRNFQERDRFIAVLNRRKEVMLREELEAAADPEDRAAVSRICDANAWEVCMPLTGSGRLIGFIGLGRKRNLEAFFAEDLELLATLAAEASIALENARLYDELKRSQDIIRRADRLSALGTLAAGIAHEIRNPLVSIQTFFQLAPERLHDEEFFTTFLGMTANEVKRISDLIAELLSFARSPTRSLGPLNLNEAVERVALLLEPEARKHSLRLTRNLSPTPPVVLADSDQIKQVLINLILNAIQATTAGGVVTVATRFGQGGEVVTGQLEVSDSGIGIPKDQLDHIFDPFYTTKDKGTGLGLSIVHQIVVEHGGSIAVESGAGSGTTFLVNLPAADSPRMYSRPSETQTAEPSIRYDRPRKAAAY